MTGRPSSFTQEKADQICHHIASGQSLRSITQAKDMPHIATVFRWLADPEHVAFREHYALARESQADTFADEIVHIADTEEDPQKARVRIDARKWVAGKQRPKVYGEKLDLNHSGKVAVEAVAWTVHDPETSGS